MAPHGAVGAHEAMTPSSSFALNGRRGAVDGEDTIVRSQEAYLTYKPHLLSCSVNFESTPLILNAANLAQFEKVAIDFEGFFRL